MHKARLGLYFPASINPMVCLVAPTASAKSPWVISCSARAAFKRKFFATCPLLFIISDIIFDIDCDYHLFSYILYTICYYLQYIYVIILEINCKIKSQDFSQLLLSLNLGRCYIQAFTNCRKTFNNVFLAQTIFRDITVAWMNTAFV